MNQEEQLAELFLEFCRTIKSLRHPTTGCPWDLEQTHESLRKYMIEEAYEACEVMSPLQPSLLKEELGDVLLQVVLNAQLASESKHFSMEDVIQSINEKMIRRHPHVFGNEKDLKQRGQEQIQTNWEAIKQSEKSSASHDGIFGTLKKSKQTPASKLALEIGKISKTIQFDWTTPQEVLTQVYSEIDELKAEILSQASPQKIYEEMGDVFFSLFQLCRHLRIDPETCAFDANTKFLNRFKKLEQLAQDQHIDVKTVGTKTLEKLWLEAKTLEKASHD